MASNSAQTALDLCPGKYSKEFEEFEKLGQGGQGIVYRVEEKLTKNICAIKKIFLKGNFRISYLYADKNSLEII